MERMWSLNICGNIISGQVTGETAKQLSERFGKILKDRSSFSINRTDISINRSQQLESAIPPSKIAALSSGEFVGMVADEPGQKLELKAFHAEILNDHVALKKEQENFTELPLIWKLDESIIQQNYAQIKEDIEDLVHTEIERIMNSPELEHLLIRK